VDISTAVGKRLRIRLSSIQSEAFETYYQELISARKRISLTSLRDRESIERRHFLESLALLKALEDAGALGSPVIDIGSGAGFPGVPIKIARPELEMALLEATEKKAAFLAGLIEKLGLAGVRVIHGRAEDVAHEPGEREAYALAVARAVAPLPTLVELALPFVRVGGYLAAPKGSAAAREVREAENALSACGGAVESMFKLDVPAPGPAPTLILVRKIAGTPERYPRRSGMPSKRPL
jgi:16S rRNA (guanine527-N7)-methyltransferase